MARPLIRVDRYQPDASIRSQPATLALRIGHAISSTKPVLNPGCPGKRADDIPRTRTGMTLVPLG